MNPTDNTSVYSLTLLDQISSEVRSGAVFAYPTEAVWGLGASIDYLAAIERILLLKNRSIDKGLIIVCSDLRQVEDLILPLTEEQKQLISSVQNPDSPATTWILPCRDDVSRLLRGEHQSLAVRLSLHPVVESLCQQVGALVSTSANTAGLEPAISQQQVQDYFPSQLDFIVAGELGGQQAPSQIRTLDGQILR